VCVCVFVMVEVECMEEVGILCFFYYSKGTI